MQDRTARHEIEEEQKLERNFKKNIFSGKTTFIGIVMSDPGAVPDISEGQVTQNNFRAVKVFIEGVDDSFVDPKAIIDSMADDEKQSEAFNNVVGGLLTAYPDSELKAGEPNPNFQMGCRVELRFFEQGPQSDHHGKMRGLRYTKVLNSSDSRYSALAGQFEPFGNSSFNTGTPQTVGNVEAMFFKKMSAISFIDRLKADRAFAGYSDAALAGVAANANAESAFYSTAAGDQRVAGATERAIPTVNGISKNPGKYCSFGFFQLNVCGQGAEGMLIAKKHKFMNDDGTWTPTGQQDFVTFIQKNNGQEQLNYVGPRLVQLGLDRTTTNPYTFGYEMCVKFEKPVRKEEKGKERGATAEKILRDYQAAKAAPTSNN